MGNMRDGVRPHDVNVVYSTYPKPSGSRCRPFLVDFLNNAHIVMEARNRMFGRVVAIVAADQIRRIRVDAEKVGGAPNTIDFLGGECRQSRSWETLLLAVVLDAIDHYLRIIAVLREYRMSEPAELQEQSTRNIFVMSACSTQGILGERAAFASWPTGAKQVCKTSEQQKSRNYLLTRRMSRNNCASIE